MLGIRRAIGAFTAAQEAQRNAADVAKIMAIFPAAMLVGDAIGTVLGKRLRRLLNDIASSEARREIFDECAEGGVIAEEIQKAIAEADGFRRVGCGGCGACKMDVAAEAERPLGKGDDGKRVGPATWVLPSFGVKGNLEKDGAPALWRVPVSVSIRTEHVGDREDGAPIFKAVVTAVAGLAEPTGGPPAYVIG